MYDLLRTVDLSIFGFLNDWSGQSVFGDRIVVFFGEYLAYIVLLVVGIVALRSFRAAKKSEAYLYAVAILSGFFARYAVAELIRFFYHRPRPFVALNIPHLLTETSYAFPSGHAIFFFALAAGVFAANKRLGTWLFVVAILIGLGRVAAGVHYPSDIFGGAVLGVLVGFLGSKLYRMYASRKHIS